MLKQPRLPFGCLITLGTALTVKRMWPRMDTKVEIKIVLYRPR